MWPSERISGTTSATPSLSTITISATNAGGTTSATLVLSVRATGAPVITSAASASGVAFHPLRYVITASKNPTSFSAIGLPAGLALDSTTGVIHGTPTASGTSQVSIRATNANGTGIRTLTLAISPTGTPPSATDPALVLVIKTEGTGRRSAESYNEWLPNIKNVELAIVEGDAFHPAGAYPDKCAKITAEFVERHS